MSWTMLVVKCAARNLGLAVKAQTRHFRRLNMAHVLYDRSSYRRVVFQPNTRYGPFRTDCRRPCVVAPSIGAFRCNSVSSTRHPSRRRCHSSSWWTDSIPRVKRAHPFGSESRMLWPVSDRRSVHRVHPTGSTDCNHPRTSESIRRFRRDERPSEFGEDDLLC